MVSQANKKNDKIKIVYKSLYEVKDKYLPNADLEFLECSDDDLSQEIYLKMLHKLAPTSLIQQTKEK